MQEWVCFDWNVGVVLHDISTFNVFLCLCSYTHARPFWTSATSPKCIFLLGLDQGVGTNVAMVTESSDVISPTCMQTFTPYTLMKFVKVNVAMVTCLIWHRSWVFEGWSSGMRGWSSLLWRPYPLHPHSLHTSQPPQPHKPHPGALLLPQDGLSSVAAQLSYSEEDTGRETGCGYQHICPQTRSTGN